MHDSGLALSDDQIKQKRSPNFTAGRSCLLHQQAVSEDLGERRAVAVHPETPVNLLSKLAQDDTPGVRKAVAFSPNILLELLWKVAEEFPETVHDKSQMPLPDTPL